MLTNYLKLTFRNLARQKLYGLINILGLSVGLACCILALLAITREWSFDRFHDRADRIVRVLREREGGGETQVRWLTSGALARAIEADLPDVERATKSRIYRVRARVRLGEERRDTEVLQGHVDEHFFSVFSFRAVAGDLDALDEPYAAAVTRSAALRLFGTADVIGKTVTLEERYYGGDYRIAVVLADPPATSSLLFDILHRTMPRTEEGRLDWTTWQGRVQQAGIETHLLLREGVKPAELETRLPEFLERHMGPEVGAILTYRLQPLLRRHLYTFSDYGLVGEGDIRTVYLFAAVALFILLIAVVNYTNLATARSARRAREVGLRKVMGARRAQLLGQFLGESILLTLLALIAGILLAHLALPHFDLVYGGGLARFEGGFRAIAPALVALALCVGILAGIYPALFLAAFEPARVLKSGTGSARRSGAAFRKALVTLQFAVSVLLIIGTGVVAEQLAFIRGRKLGFEKELFVVLPLFRTDREGKADGEPWLAGSYNTVRTEFLRHPGVVAASAFRSLPGQDRFFVRIVKPEGQDDTEWRMPVQECDESFFDAFGVPLLAGRTFDPARERDRTHGWIINKAAVDAMGWTPENAVGRRFGRARSAEDAMGEVIGVVGNFHIASLHEPIGPQAFGYRQWFYDYIGLRIRSDRVTATLADAEATWKRLMRPDQPFQVDFLDDIIARQYEGERRMGQIVGAFSVLAIFLACMGLFALSAYSAEQRIREIGIRKVLGASVPQLVTLLVAEFLKLVAVGCLVAWPVAYFATGRWLETFAYRAAFDPILFLGGGLAAGAVALLTVGYHALRAAWTDPARTLRYE